MINKQDRSRFIGDRVRSARQAAGFSQKELAENIGFESATAISLIEAGERKIGIVELEKMAKTLDREIGYFIGEEGQQLNTRTALRAEKISEEDRKAILHILEMAKNRHASRDGKTADRSS